MPQFPCMWRSVVPLPFGAFPLLSPWALPMDLKTMSTQLSGRREGANTGSLESLGNLNKENDC